MSSATSDTTVLSRELAFFEQHKAEYLKQFPGLFVLIKDQEMKGPYPTAEAAYLAGVSAFGLEPFLVKQVLESEPTVYMPAFTLTPAVDARP